MMRCRCLSIERWLRKLWITSRKALTLIDRGIMLGHLGAGLFVEAAVVGIVCIVFLVLFLVAGIKQILSDRD